MIILLSYHGEFLGELGLQLKEEPWPYEELTQIPFMIRQPYGMGKGKRIKGFADTTDIMPTILDFFQVLGPNAKKAAFEATKFIPGAGTDEIEGHSLLPLISGEKEKDWMERKNVIDQYPEVAERMELRLRRFMQRYSSSGRSDYGERSAIGYFWTPKK